MYSVGFFASKLFCNVLIHSRNFLNAIVYDISDFCAHNFDSRKKGMRLFFAAQKLEADFRLPLISGH